MSSIIHDTAGDEAEIIFGTVHDPKLDQEIRVTVIATGFEPVVQSVAPRVIRQPQLGTRRAPAVAGVGGPERSLVALDFSDPRDLEIPTFIRRQMD